jgi:hypothetical protein
MLRMHRCNDGRKMFVSQMEDDHLKKTIELHFRKLENLKKAVTAKVNITPFKASLYGVDTAALHEMAQGKIKHQANALYPYLAEAMLRGFDYKEQLQTIFERTGKEADIAVIDVDDFPQLLEARKVHVVEEEEEEEAHAF